MAGLDPAIHPFGCFHRDVDARVKPAHDGGNVGGEAQLQLPCPAGGG